MSKIIKSDNIEIRAGSILLTSGYGTPSNPNITQEDNTSVGIYFPSANNIGISTNGLERLSIDNTGLIRISNLSIDGNFSVNSGINISPNNVAINGDLLVTGNIIVSNVISGNLSGTALNAELLSGYAPSASASPNTIVLRDSNGDGYFSKINITGLDNEVSSGNITQIYVKSSDSFIRKASLNAAASAIFSVATGTWNIAVTGALIASGFSSNKTISLSNHVTGSISTDFFTNPTLPATIPSGTITSAMLDDITTAGTFGDTAYRPIVTVNSKGRVTSASTVLAGGIFITGSAPVSPTQGQVWYNTSGATLQFYNGTTTRTIWWG